MQHGKKWERIHHPEKGEALRYEVAKMRARKFQDARITRAAE